MNNECFAQTGFPLAKICIFYIIFQLRFAEIRTTSFSATPFVKAHFYSMPSVGICIVPVSGVRSRKHHLESSL